MPIKFCPLKNTVSQIAKPPSFWQEAVMSTRKDKAIQTIQQIWQLSKVNRKEQMQWLMRGLLVSRRTALSEAGFVLPTVAMVSLVVVLLTTAILIRSLIDLETPVMSGWIRQFSTLLPPRSIALEPNWMLYSQILRCHGIPNRYRSLTFLTVLGILLAMSAWEFHDINGIGGIQEQPGTTYVLENDETLDTAWKFAADTDNNGKLDSYTLYSINFRSPTRGPNGQFNRARNPLEARTLPMNGTSGGVRLRARPAPV